MDITTTQGMKQALTDKLRLGFGVTPEEADDAQVMRAAALVLRDVMTERGVESRMATRREEKRKVHYLSMEFLLGRSLEKNAYNLGVSGVLREAIGELGFRAADIFEVEPDAFLLDQVVITSSKTESLRRESASLVNVTSGKIFSTSEPALSPTASISNPACGLRTTVRTADSPRCA